MTKKQNTIAKIVGILAILSAVLSLGAWVYSQLAVQVIVHWEMMGVSGFIVQFIKALLSGFLGQIISVLPSVLFAIYALFLYSKNKNNKLLPISFVVMALSTLFSMVTTSFNAITMLTQGASVRNVLTYAPTLIVSLIFIVLSVVLAVDAFANFKFLIISRIVVIIKLALPLAASVLSILALVFAGIVLLFDSSYSFVGFLQLSATTLPVLVSLIMPAALVLFYFACLKKEKAEEVYAEEQIQE